MASQHPSNLTAFYVKHPSFVWGPVLLMVFVRVFCTIRPIAGHLTEMNAERYGMFGAAVYVAYSITLAYAVHGWMVCHADQRYQLQSYGHDNIEILKCESAARPAASYREKSPPVHEAVRTVATLFTSLVYAIYPFAPVTISWSSFIVWTFGLAFYWDLHFYVCHRLAHENRTAYTFFHKLHHENKQPGPFNAYFVTYQSHILTEQAVVLIMALCGLPKDVFTFALWYGTLSTFIEHAGHDMDNVKLPIVGEFGVTWGVFSTALSPWSLLLGGESTAEHDWHHEKFTTNYALSFKYLDKLMGTYHPDREPGEAIKPKATADQTQLVYSMKEDPGPIDGPTYRLMPGKLQMDQDDEYGQYDAPAPCFCSGLEFDD